MEYKLDKQIKTPHRDTWFEEFVSCRNLRIDGMAVFVVKLARDDKWWIVPCAYSDDELLSDVGPYDTSDDALLMMKLLGEY